KLFFNRFVVLLRQCVHNGAAKRKSDTGVHIDNGRLAAIVQIETNLEGYADIIRIITLDVEKGDSKPRAMIVSEGCLSIYEGLAGSLSSALRSVRSLLISTVHLDRISGVNREENGSADFHERLSLVPPILFCFAS